MSDISIWRRTFGLPPELPPVVCPHCGFDDTVPTFDGDEWTCLGCLDQFTYVRNEVPRAP